MGLFGGKPASDRPVENATETGDTRLPSSEIDSVTTVEFRGLNFDSFQCKVAYALITYALPKNLILKSAGYDEAGLRKEIDEHVLKELNINKKDIRRFGDKGFPVEQFINHLKENECYRPLCDQVCNYPAHWAQVAYWSHWHRYSRLTEE